MTDVYNDPDLEQEFDNDCNDADDRNDIRKLDLFELLSQTFNPNQIWKQA